MNYTLIESEPETGQIAEYIKSNNLAEIAVDFEGESNLHRYGIHLCLVQINTGKQIFIIDPLQIQDFSFLKTILENKNITKVMFAAEFDVKLLKYTHNISIKNIFDLQAGYKLLGYEKLGLENIVTDVLGAGNNEIIKKQKSDWNKRPLSEEQILYAINDVADLFRLKIDIEKRLDSEMEKQFKEVCRNVENYEFEKKRYPYLSIKGSGNLTSVEKIFLKHFYNARESIAQTIDFPPYWVIGNKQLLLMAQKKQISKDQLIKEFSFPKRAISMIDYFEKAMLKATAEVSGKNLSF